MSAAEGNRFPVDRRWPSGVGVFSLRREEVEIEKALHLYGGPFDTTDR
jgi:hypothetical protein